MLAPMTIPLVALSIIGGAAALVIRLHNRRARDAFTRSLSLNERADLDRFCESGGTWRKYRDIKRFYLDS